MNSVQRELKVLEKTTGNKMLDNMKALFNRVSLMHLMNVPNKHRGTGITIACVQKDGYNYFGVAFCGKKDQFSRKMGREIALGRAAKAYANGTGHKVGEFVKKIDGIYVPPSLYLTKGK